MALDTIAVFRKKTTPRAEQVAGDVRSWAEARGVRAVDEREMARRAGAGEPLDLVVVLGGDGTLLAAVRALGGREVPILGVNLGTMGFLTEITPSELGPTLDRLARDGPVVEARTALDAVLERAGRTVRRYRVLNDVVFNKGALARICDLEVRVGGAYLTTYKGDGLVVSTPTGSTAYSLSAGGPIVTVDLPATVLTPICPHTLTQRPILVADAARIEVRLVSKNGAVYLTLDGQEGAELEEGDVVTIEKAPTRVLLVRSIGRTHYEVLRTKLMWGGGYPGNGTP